MTERTFYFTPELEAIANESGITEVATRIHDSRDDPDLEDDEDLLNAYDNFARDDQLGDYVTDELYNFHHSPEYKLLDTSDQLSSILFASLPEGASWRLLGNGEETQDRLFGVSKFVGSVACDPIDRITISGAGGWDYLKLEPEIFNDYQRHGFSSRLGIMQLAGAWLCSLTSLRGKILQATV